MCDSSRLVSVVFSHLALLCGLLALPTPGQSQGVNFPVLNWIPPTSLTGSPCDFFVSGCGSKLGTGIIQMWSGMDGTHPFAMVGRDPTVKGTGATQIDVRIVPLKFTFTTPPPSSTTLTFDTENNDACSPRKFPALNMVQQSPLFAAPSSWSQPPSLKVLGKGQFASLFQRANLWAFIQPNASPNYQITLSQTLTNAMETKAIAIVDPATMPNLTTLPYTINGVVQTDTHWCTPLAMIDVNELDTLLQKQIIPALKGIKPATLPIFFLSNVVMSPDTSTPICCIVGYHSAYSSATTGATAGKLQTYIVANYDTTSGSNFKGAFPDAPDLVALSNMIAAWIDNPTTLNTTPPWTGTINGVTGPQTTLEVADPPDLVGQLTKIMMTNKNVYHVQDLAFKSWFFCDTTPPNNFNFGYQNGVYSLFGTLKTPNPTC